MQPVVVMIVTLVIGTAVWLSPYVQAKIKCDTPADVFRTSEYVLSNKVFPLAGDFKLVSAKFHDNVPKWFTEQYILPALDKFLDTCLVIGDDVQPPTPVLTFVSNNDGRCFFCPVNCAIQHNYGTDIISLDTKACADIETVIHEVMHFLGFGHEQSRKDRDDYVEVKMNEMKDDCKSQYNMRGRDGTDNHTPYDYYSIMHYRLTDCSRSGKPTMILKNKDYNKYAHLIGNANDFSSLDRVKLSRVYGCFENRKWCVDSREDCKEHLFLEYKRYGVIPRIWAFASGALNLFA